VSTPIAVTSPVQITRRRYAAQTWGTDGRPDRGASSDLAITAVVAPASPREMRLLPDGLRTRSAVTVLSYTEIRTANQHDALPPDELLIDSVAYVVQVVLGEHPAIGPLPRSWQVLAVRRPELPAVGGP